MARCCLTEALTVARQVKDEATDGRVLAELELLVRCRRNEKLPLLSRLSL